MKYKKNNLIFIVFDSCRFDTFESAKTKNILRLGDLEKSYAYASWTAPSHAVYLTGVSPHKSPKRIFASEVYKKDFTHWSNRLNIPDISFRGFVPELSLPAFLKKNGYKTCAMVSMPVLNQATIFNQFFDEYQLMPSHNDFNAILDKIKFESDRPVFYFLNIGETHYPYTLPGEDAKHLPRIHGVHGVFKHMDDFVMEARNGIEGKFFTRKDLAGMKEKQKKNIQYLDKLFEKLYELIPKNTHIIVTSDHGELFGEDNYFGHGPIFHKKVFEIPFVEGILK